ncbi:AAA family ATPase [Mycobacterium sp.]|uniref:AAA family ATPase n=1 Tax=Mycobacterium sp. TaxID=1785 RepID=UPI00333F9177
MSTASWGITSAPPSTPAAVRTQGALVQPLSAPAGAGKTTSMRALHAAVHNGAYHHVLLANTRPGISAAAEG